MARLEAAGAALIRRWARTLRVTFHGWNGQRIVPGDPWFNGRLFAVCERDLLALLPFAGYRDYVTVVASGRDGNRAAAVLEALGLKVARGSAGRDGAAAMRTVLRLITPERSVLVSVDGPLGPAGVAKPGVLTIGARCGREVVPIAAAARWALTFPGTWSGIYLPLPFSRVCLQTAEPLPARGATTRQERAQAAAVLTARLHEARRQARARAHSV